MDPSSPIRSARAVGWPLLLVLGALIAAFATSTLLAQESAIQGRRSLVDVADVYARRTKHLSELRGQTQHLKLDVAEVVAASRRGRHVSFVQVDTTLRRMNTELDAYLALPALRGEEAVRSALPEAFFVLQNRAETVARRLPPKVAVTLPVAELAPSTERFTNTLARALEENTRSADALAHAALDAQRRTAALSRTSSASAGFFAFVAAIILGGHLRRHRTLREANLRLEGECAELDAFSGRVAHDLSNPVAAAHIALEMIRRSTAEPRTRDLVDKALCSVGRAQRIMNDLLEFARAGAQLAEGVGADVLMVVRGVLAELGPVADQASVKLCLEASSSRLDLACSEGALTSIVSNLVKNAIKHMGAKEERVITVRIRARDGLALTEVQDTGPGVAPPIERTLFEPFVRGAGSPAEGLGLGLATVKRLVEGYGGRVGVRSVGGSGSVFWFELPLAEPSSLGASAPSS